jgi:hypothetical protein
MRIRKAREKEAIRNWGYCIAPGYLVLYFGSSSSGGGENWGWIFGGRLGRAKGEMDERRD